MATTTPTFYVDRMMVADIAEVIEIERESFSLPWPINAYKRELQDNRTAHYVVVRKAPPSGTPPPSPNRESDESKGIFSFLLRRQPPPRAREGPPTIFGYAGL